MHEVREVIRPPLEKEPRERVARASGVLVLKDVQPLEAVISGAMKKGSLVDEAASTAAALSKGIGLLLPHCHPREIDSLRVEVSTETRVDGGAIRIEIEIRGRGTVGIEMEALGAVTGALLAAVDLVRSQGGTWRLDDIRVEEQ